MSKDAFSAIQVGKTRSGKTTFCRNILQSVVDNDPERDIIIYDINNEHNDYYDEPFEKSLDEFMNSIKDVENSFIFIEEASIFFEARSTDKILKELLVTKRHRNNIIYLNFHSFGMIPNYVFHLVNYVTVFKTNDSFNKVKSKFDNEKLLNAFEFVKNSKDKFEHKTVNIG